MNNCTLGWGADYVGLKSPEYNHIGPVREGYPICISFPFGYYTLFTARYNNMRTLKFKAQPTNAFFATVNQMFGGSSQLPTTAERAVIKSLFTVQTTKQCSAVVVSWEDPPNIWLSIAKNAFVGRPLNFRVRMLLKGAAMSSYCYVWRPERKLRTVNAQCLRFVAAFTVRTDRKSKLRTESVRVQ